MSDETKCEIRKVKMTEVMPMEDNPRTISDRALAGLEASISRFGYVEPIIWNEQTGHIVGGHQRFSVLKELSVEEATMVVVNMTPDEEMAANLTLNNPRIEGNWDDSALPLLTQMEEAGNELFDSLNMDSLKEFLEEKPPTPSTDGKDGIGDGDGDGEDDDWENAPDTECPCCSHKWRVGADDVSVEEVSEPAT